MLKIDFPTDPHSASDPDSDPDSAPDSNPTSNSASNNFSQQTKSEWLETNGLGGYASSTACGLNTRGYHGLLIASPMPPTNQFLLVSRLDETIIVPNTWQQSLAKPIPQASAASEDSSSVLADDAAIQNAAPIRFELAVREFPGIYAPNGASFLKSISKETHPTFLYEIPHPSAPIKNIRIQKEIICPHEQQVCIIKYSLLSSPPGQLSNPGQLSGPDQLSSSNRLSGPNRLASPDHINIELRPFLAGRSIHGRTRARPNLFSVRSNDNDSRQDQIEIVQNEEQLSTFIAARNSVFVHQPDWYYNFQLHEERLRGYDFSEDLFTPGVLHLELSHKQPVYIVLSFQAPCSAPAQDLFDEEVLSRKKLISSSPAATDDFSKQLTLAADQFIVKRGDSKSIIAGYPWFTDWGRDAMIALPGLCLSTGRFNDAREILKTFADNLKNGLIPNRFLDSGEPEYNSVDASLWFIVAVHEYYKATRDLKFVRDHCLPAISEIIEEFCAGTDFDISCDADGLLRAGSPQTQLTWMDARIERMAVTPRSGKAVEVNALWYNALRIAAAFNLRLMRLGPSYRYHKLAKLVRHNFEQAFWYQDGGYLFDVISNNSELAGAGTGAGEKFDPILRPNQIFALSLPYPLLDQHKAQRVLQVIENKLLTPFGLRTLSSDHPLYCPHYQGDIIDRDLAYHQGTVWLWLLGPYMQALKRYGGKDSQQKIDSLRKGLEPQLLQAGLGTLSEIYDGDAPHLPRGCIAQAWGVAAMLER